MKIYFKVQCSLDSLPVCDSSQEGKDVAERGREPLLPGCREDWVARKYIASWSIYRNTQRGDYSRCDDEGDVAAAAGIANTLTFDSPLAIRANSVGWYTRLRT